MKAYKVTIPFKKFPWYTVSRVVAPDKAKAIVLALSQAYGENAMLRSAKYKKPLAKEVL